MDIPQTPRKYFFYLKLEVVQSITLVLDFIDLSKLCNARSESQTESKFYFRLTVMKVFATKFKNNNNDTNSSIENINKEQINISKCQIREKKKGH